MFAQSLFFFLVAEHYAVSDVSCISFSSASPNTRGPWLMNYELKCIQLLWHTARSLRPAVWEALFETAARMLSTKPIGKVRTLHGSFLFIAVIFLRHVLCAGQRRTNFMDKGGHKLSAEAQTEGRQEHSTATAYSGNWETSPNPGAVNGTFRKPNWRYLTNKRISKVYSSTSISGTSMGSWIYYIYINIIIYIYYMQTYWDYYCILGSLT